MAIINRRRENIEETVAIFVRIPCSIKAALEQEKSMGGYRHSQSFQSGKRIIGKWWPRWPWPGTEEGRLIHVHHPCRLENYGRTSSISDACRTGGSRWQARERKAIGVELSAKDFLWNLLFLQVTGVYLLPFSCLLSWL